jgi:hypothetical protein
MHKIHKIKIFLILLISAFLITIHIYTLHAQDLEAHYGSGQRPANPQQQPYYPGINLQQPPAGSSPAKPQLPQAVPASGSSPLTQAERSQGILGLPTQPGDTIPRYKITEIQQPIDQPAGTKPALAGAKPPATATADTRVDDGKGTREPKTEFGVQEKVALSDKETKFREGTWWSTPFLAEAQILVRVTNGNEVTQTWYSLYLKDNPWDDQVAFAQAKPGESWVHPKGRADANFEATFAERMDEPMHFILGYRSGSGLFSDTWSIKEAGGESVTATPRQILQWVGHSRQANGDFETVK